MIEGCPFLFQAMQGTVYHVSEKGVEVVRSRSWSPKETIVAFVDIDRANHEPDHILRDRSVQLIVASSPKGTNQPWANQAGFLISITQLVIQLWSDKELFLTGSVLALLLSRAFVTRLMPLYRIFLYPIDLPFRLLKESTLYFGHNPRRCLTVSSSASKLEDQRVHVSDSITDAVTKASTSDDLMQLLRKTRKGGSNISHTIFQNFPADERRLFSACQYGTVSQWAFDLVLEQYGARKAEVIADFYFNISGMPGAASLRGYLFEKQVLRRLAYVG